MLQSQIDKFKENRTKALARWELCEDMSELKHYLHLVSLHLGMMIEQWEREHPKGNS